MKIFEQSSFADIDIKNRLWRSATWLGLAEDTGKISNELNKRYEDLAKGGVGAIITGLASVLESEQPYPKMLNIHSDEIIEDYKKFTDMIHKHDCKVFMQIAYGGSTTSIPAKGRLIWGPSTVKNPSSGVTPVEMTKENIKELVEAMGQAAKRAKLAGFDGVQIHAAHGYLLSQFLSPYYNIRRDEYGGTALNRARIIFEILESIKKHTASEFPTLIKMHCDDQWGEKGLSENDSLLIAKELELRGIDAIEFSGGNIDPESGNIPSRTKLFKKEKQSYFYEATARISSELNVPVISVGGHRNIERMEEILNNSNISYFALSRPLHSEPDLPNKWIADSHKKARCVSCNNCWHEDGNQCILDR